GWGRGNFHRLGCGCGGHGYVCGCPSCCGGYGFSSFY
uniref:Uncharacterized protein n=1 Tax=Panthera tigris altaica TaxID=74533 RepID=A0A8C9M1S4_PANTA